MQEGHDVRFAFCIPAGGLESGPKSAVILLSCSPVG
jgi:hypothetical protein